jgi:hypothetical protein
MNPHRRDAIQRECYGVSRGSALTLAEGLRNVWFRPLFGHCADRGPDEPVGRLNLPPAVDAQLLDQEPQQRLGRLRLGFGNHALERRR